MTKVWSLSCFTTFPLFLFLAERHRRQLSETLEPHEGLIKFQECQSSFFDSCDDLSLSVEQYKLRRRQADIRWLNAVFTGWTDFPASMPEKND